MQAHLPHTRGAEVSMGSGAFYNERRFLWEVIRFVWAVTCMRGTPPVRAEEGAGSACRASPADQSAFKRAYRIRGARGSYGQ